MTLNQDQETTAASFFGFLFSTDKEFSISGPAGTGKTYLLQHLLKETIPEFYAAQELMGLPKVQKYSVAMTATTNKAAEVLTQATGILSSTIHSHLGLKVSDDYKTGKSKTHRSMAWTAHVNQIIFIDEASMIDSGLYKFLHEGTDKSCKIVYLGDHCQMTPVFEDLSPVYKNATSISTLLQPMRNAGQPALMALCSQLRRSVETQVFKPIREVPGIIDYVSQEQAYDYIDKAFQKEDVDSRVLCFTNSRVQQYNDYIRDLRGHPTSRFTIGERVINNTAIPQSAHGMMRIEEEFLIKDIQSGSEAVLAYTEDPNSCFYVYNILLEPAVGKAFWIRVPEDKETFKNLMAFYSQRKEWAHFYNLKNVFPDLRSRDAMTVYKAQGSTYETVFLDLANIGTCYNKDQLARMLYVGASRATTRLVLYGNLPSHLFKNNTQNGWSKPMMVVS